MATLLGDMRSGHSQWSSEASRNCLAADLYLGRNSPLDLVDNSDKIEFWTIEELRESSISIFEYIPKLVFWTHFLVMRSAKPPAHFSLVTSIICSWLWSCKSMFYNIWKYRACSDYNQAQVCCIIFGNTELVATITTFLAVLSVRSGVAKALLT